MPLLTSVQMTVASAPGTGTITLGSATVGSQSWAAAGAVNGARYGYRIEEDSRWEVGIGTYTASGTTLSRAVIASSNANATETFSALAIVSQAANPFDIVQANGGIGSDGAAHTYFVSWSGVEPLLQVDGAAQGALFCGGNNAIGSTGSSGAYLVQRFPSGAILLQGSTLVTTDANGFATIPLGVTLTAACFAIAANGDYNTNGLAVTATGVFTTSNFKIFVGNGANISIRVNWTAWGTWK